MRGMGWMGPVLALVLAMPASAQAPAEIVTLRLPMSNVHLIKTATPVLVDAGRPGDREALVAALREQGLALRDLKLVVLTHGHSDHAGLASALQQAGARIAMGAGDATMAARGHHGELNPIGFTARILKQFAIDPTYPAFTPDVLVSTELDLAPWGLAGKVMALPGHTPGSVVVLLEDGRRAIVGDMMLGGWFGGALRPTVAGPHYFQADVKQNEANIATLLKRGVQAFHLGHGGPVSRESVQAAFADKPPATP